MIYTLIEKKTAAKASEDTGSAFIRAWTKEMATIEYNNARHAATLAMRALRTATDRRARALRALTRCK